MQPQKNRTKATTITILFAIRFFYLYPNFFPLQNVGCKHNHTKVFVFLSPIDTGCGVVCVSRRDANRCWCGIFTIKTLKVFSSTPHQLDCGYVFFLSSFKLCTQRSNCIYLVVFECKYLMGCGQPIAIIVRNFSRTLNLWIALRVVCNSQLQKWIAIGLPYSALFQSFFFCLFVVVQRQ